MASSLRSAATWISIVAVFALAGCFGQQPATAPPTRTRTPAPPTSQQPVQPTAPPAELGESVPCVAQPRTQSVPLQDDPDGSPSGVGGEDEGGVDEGRPVPVPDDPDAVHLDSLAVAGPGIGGSGGVAGGLLQPKYAGFTNSSLVSRSTSAEPNVASDGTNVLLTWNWHAAASDDGGQTFRGMDPGIFASADDFCCDQLAHYIPGRNLWVWVMQTGLGRKPNWIRVAVAHGGTPFRNAIDFTYWEWAPSSTGFFPPTTWLDRPKIGNTADQLFIAVNAFSGVEKPEGALVLRMPLDELDAGTAVSARCYGTPSQPVPVSVAADTMYLADHATTSALWVWRWPDTADAPAQLRVPDVDATGRAVSYISKGFSCPRKSIATTDWCLDWVDSRIQTAWLSGGRIGLAWNAASDGTAQTPYPYVYSVSIDEGSMTVVDHWTVKTTVAAVAYPMFAPNARGDIGGVVMFGGGNGPTDADPTFGYPWCTAVIRDATTGEWDWNSPERNRSTKDPPIGRGETYPRIGDYQGAWPNGGNQYSWSAGCMTYKEAGTEVEFFRFGRASDVTTNQ